MNNSIMSPGHLTYRSDIDGLRAIAVLLVLIYHAFPSYLPGGFVGVDIFFVISGFLITSIIVKDLEHGKFKFSDFYCRRINRIFPSLILVLVFSFIIGWFVYLPKEFEQLSKHILGGSFFVSNLVLLSESGYFDTAAESKPLLHLWSLGIEEQFYIFWPFLLWMLYKVRGGIVGAVTLVAGASFFLNLATINNSPEFTFYSPTTRFWELTVGSLLAISINYHSESKFVYIANKIVAWVNGRHARSDVCSLLGVILLVLAVLITSKSDPFPGWYALLPTAGTFLIILGGVRATFNKYILSARVMVKIGLISFPLYLWHWPIFVFTKSQAGNALSTSVHLGLVLISFILAWFTYRFIEKPLRFSISKKRTSSMLFTASASIALLSTYVISEGGVPKRFPQIVQNVISYDDRDTTKSWRVGICHLLPKQKFENFGKCESEPKENGKPTLLLWGDSHASHLYQGLVAHLSETYRIVQMTASTCPPIANMEISVSPNCVGINNDMRQFITIEQPERIMLAAAWDVYDWKKISSTIEWLNQIGIPQIDLVGPVPRWLDSLPRQLLVYFMRHREAEIPVRMKDGLSPRVNDLDVQMSQFAQSESVNYLSPTKVLCNQDGCLTRVGERNLSLTAFDSSHLTEDGADYVVSNFEHIN